MAVLRLLQAIRTNFWVRLDMIQGDPSIWWDSNPIWIKICWNLAGIAKKLVFCPFFRISVDFDPPKVNFFTNAPDKILTPTDPPWTWWSALKLYHSEMDFGWSGIFQSVKVPRLWSTRMYWSHGGLAIQIFTILRRAVDTGHPDGSWEAHFSMGRKKLAVSPLLVHSSAWLRIF